MKLQLYINGNLFNELKIADEELEMDPDTNFVEVVEVKTEIVEQYVSQLKSMFFRQINKAQSFEIIMLIDSKLNTLKKISEDEYIETLQ